MAVNNEILEKGWNFDNSYTRLPETFYSSVNPTPVKVPKLIIFNERLAEFLGWDKKELQRPAWRSNARLPDTTDPN